MKNQIKPLITPELIQWAKENNKRIIVNEDGINYEELGEPINYSDIICYSIIILGVLGLIFQFLR